MMFSLMNFEMGSCQAYKRYLDFFLISSSQYTCLFPAYNIWGWMIKGNSFLCWVYMYFWDIRSLKESVQNRNWPTEVSEWTELKEYYEIFSSSHLNKLLSQINIVPKTNLFPKYHISKHYRTRVKCDTKNNKNKK